MIENVPNDVVQQTIDACPGPWQQISGTSTTGEGIQFYRTSELTPIRITLEEVVDFITHYSPVGTNVQEEFEDFFQRVARICGEGNSVETGEFDPSSPLRAEGDPEDCMGAGTDPGEMGNAEKYFRGLQDEETATEGCPDDCPCMGPPEEMPF